MPHHETNVLRREILPFCDDSRGTGAASVLAHEGVRAGMFNAGLMAGTTPVLIDGSPVGKLVRRCLRTRDADPQSGAADYETAQTAPANPHQPLSRRCFGQIA